MVSKHVIRVGSHPACCAVSLGPSISLIHTKSNRLPIMYRPFLLSVYGAMFCALQTCKRPVAVQKTRGRVAVCVRVCWYCHQSGGTDVVDLPDILLPAGQYLDLFDSESETDVPSDSSDEELVEV